MKIKKFLTVLTAIAAVVAMSFTATAADAPEAQELEEEVPVIAISDGIAATVTNETTGKNETYADIDDAFAALKAGDTVTISEGIHYLNKSTEWAPRNAEFWLPDNVTIIGEEGAIIQREPVFHAKGLNVKNVDFLGYADVAMKIHGNAKFEDCTITGPNGIYYSTVSEKLEFVNCTVKGDVYGLHVGEGTGDVVIDECTISGWNTYGNIGKVTITDTTFLDDSSYAFLGFYQEAEIKNCEFEPGMEIAAQDTTKANITITECTVTDGSDISGILDKGSADCISLNVAKIGETYYSSISDAIKDATDGQTVTILPGTHKGGFSVGGKNITLEGTLVDGEIATIIDGDNGASSYYRYAISMGVGTIKNLKIVNAWKGIFTESKSGNFTIDNVEMVEIGYGIHIAEAKQETDVITVKNSNIDVTWANSFASGPYSLVFENNVLTANKPYYGEGKPSPVVNSNVANTTISENIFGENATIYLDEEKVENAVIGTNYYAKGFENAFYSGSAIVPIYTEYKTPEKKEVVTTSDLKATIGETYYPSIQAAVDAATDNAVIIVAPGTHTESLNITKPVTLTGNPNYGTATLAAEGKAITKPVISISNVTNGGVQYHAPNVVFDNLVFDVAEVAIGETWNVSAIGYYYEIVTERNGLTVTNCDFINNSDISMSAIAANIATYTVKNNTFKNFTTMVHSFVDHGALGTVVISGNKFENVDNIANVYWGAEADGESLTITDNKSTSTDGPAAKIIVDDFGKTKNSVVTAISTATITGNDGELIFHNLDNTNSLTTDEPLVYTYRSEDVLKALDGKLPDGTVYVQYGTADEQMFIVENGYYKKPADSVELVFVENTTADDLDNSVWDIVLVANKEGIINRLNSADFTFELVTDKTSDDMAYEIVAVNSEIAINNVNNDANRFEFHYDGKDDVNTDTATRITIGQVRFTGYGAFTFKAATADTNAVHATTFVDNIVDSFTAAAGNLTVNNAAEDADNDTDFGTIDSAILVPTTDLTLNITFPNAVSNQVADYQKMSVTVSGGDLDKAVAVELGSTPVIPAVATDVKPDAVVTAAFANGAYVVNVTDLLTINTAYTVTVEGAGYRTYRYTVTMTGDKTLNFWNNVKDNDTVVEKDKKTEKVTYLAGDIVKDSLINIYDLSAVVSYFGETELVGNNNDYAKYDLNRDGKIDSKDVAYVLVSWGK